MARPKLQLDTDLIERLAAIGCTVKEIAAAMKCSVDTIDNNYSEFIDKGRENGKTSLRKKQYEVAMTGNVTMLIWLGKQMLDQKEKQEFSNPDGEGFKIIIEDYKEK